MASKGRSALINQGRGVDAAWYTNGVQRYGTRGNTWATTENAIEERFDYAPTSSTTTSASTWTFEIDKRADLLEGTPVLMFTRPAGVEADRLIGAHMSDYEAASWAQEMRFIYNNKLVHSISGQRIVREFMLCKDDKQRSAFKELTLGGLSISARQALFMKAKQLFLPILVPWEEIERSLCIQGLPNKIRVEVDIRAANKVTKILSGALTTTSITFSDVVLRQNMVHLSEASRASYFAKTKTANGIVDKILTAEYQLSQSVPDGTHTLRVNLPNIKNNSPGIRIMHNLTAEVTGSGTPPLPEYHNYKLPVSAYIEDGGTAVTETVTPYKWSSMFDGNKAHSRANLGLGILEFYFTHKEWVEASDKNCLDGRTLGKYNNPVLVLNYDLAVPPTSYDTVPHIPMNMPVTTASGGITGAHTLDIENLFHNNLIQKMGDWRKLLL